MKLRIARDGEPCKVNLTASPFGDAAGRGSPSVEIDDLAVRTLSAITFAIGYPDMLDPASLGWLIEQVGKLSIDTLDAETTMIEAMMAFLRSVQQEKDALHA